MQTAKTGHMILEVVSGTIPHAIGQFILERRTRNLSHHTLRFYKDELYLFVDYLGDQGVELLSELTPETIRGYLLHLAGRRNGGGCHAAFRAIRALLLWAWEEYELPGRNPISRVAAPKQRKDVLPGVPLEDVARMVKACSGDRLARRDASVLLTLLDTGVRAGELIALDIGDLALANGTITVRHGKGDKQRTVYAGRTTRKALRAYLNTRMEAKKDEPLFITIHGERLTIPGLRRMLEKRAGQAGIKAPSLHSFRRCFALEALRNGVDVFSLQELLGHSDLSVLKRYLKQTDQDLHAAHVRGSPVERMQRK